MSRKGNGWDNAPAESWFDSFKNEAIYGNRFATHELMKTTCFDYIEVRYNRKRLHPSQVLTINPLGNFYRTG